MSTNIVGTAQPFSTAHLNHWQKIRRTFSNALIITRREIRDSIRDWRIVVPLVILTFFFPFLAQIVAAEFSAYVTKYGAQIIGERTIPFLLMVVGFFPISISLVIALETFVGEKERRSLEPLLSTPLTNTELYIGKTLSSMIPPLFASYIGMGVYLGSLAFKESTWSPPMMLIVQIVLLTSVQALVMVTGAVVVSSQTTSTRAANLLASFIVIPMALAVQGESIIIFLAPDAESQRGIMSLWAIIIGMLVATVLLLRVGNSIFNREELLGRTIDQINLRGTFRKIGRFIRAVDIDGTPAKSILDWYKRGMPSAIRQFKSAYWITLTVFLIAFGAGIAFSQTAQWQLPIPSQDELIVESEHPLQSYLDAQAQHGAMLFILMQNIRAVVGALLLSIFSLGVGALALMPVTFLLLGYLVGLMIHAHYTLTFIAGAILTHGVIEIPAVFLATGAALALGAAITRPPKGETVGHAWIVALGATLRLMLGLVIPGLIIAAFIEAFITPQVILWILGG